MKITVIGAALSGEAAAKLARQNGMDVFVTESKPPDNFKDSIKAFNEYGIEYEFGANSAQALAHTDLIITSPGVPPTAPLIIEAEKRGISIISELEYASQQLKNPCVAITGTNGKTTTTMLTAFMLNKSGRPAIAAGNIGTPLSSLVGNIDGDTIIVAEVSSFQLDRIKTFHPQVAAILNITPDHLYYHGTMNKYSEAKFKISCNQSEKDLLILNADDVLLYGGNKNVKARIDYFSMSSLERGICFVDGKMVYRTSKHKEEEIMLFDELRLPGVHNAYNSMAAALIGRAFEIRNENIRDSLMAFEGVEHRLEPVRILEGVEYINDSKATNINAAWYALSSYKKNPIVWIAGGRGDSNDYSILDENVNKYVKCIIAIGEEQDAIFDHFCATKTVVRASSLDDALQIAQKNSSSGDVVLFSPACKSFDMFVNYEHRGEVFKEIVHQLNTHSFQTN